MIKYVELTAPDASAFRQAKIISIECNEGDTIKEGDTLFRVQSGAHEINLPATKAGKVVEIIASLNENITLSTSLLLLETTVSGSTASKPIDVDSSNSKSSNDDAINVEDETAVEKTPSEAKKPRKKRNTKTVKQHQQQSLDLLGDNLPEPTQSAQPSDIENANDTTEVVLTQKAPPATIEPPQPTQTSLNMPSNTIIAVNVPDIGADSAKVIEILVNVGDSVSPEDPLITLESDKASMDVPSPNAGVVKSIAVKIDDDLSEGSLILELEADAANTEKTAEPVAEQAAPQAATIEEAPIAAAQSSAGASSIVDVKIPDIGGDSAKVIELLVSVGDQVEVEDALVTLESDKASMDVPSSVAGTIKSIEVKIDDDVSEGVVVVTVESSSAAPVEAAAPAPQAAAQQAPAPAPAKAAAVAPAASPAPANSQSKSHASPSIRRFARELGADLSLVNGSGRKGRITHDDVKAFVKGELSKPRQAAGAQGGAGIPAVPAQDFSKFGEVDVQPLNKIKRLTAENLHRSWLNVPHVTHNDESNISDLESFRKQLNKEYAAQKRDLKLSPLAFIVKAVVNAMQLYPQFNSSLEAGGENLIYKKYFNIGIAVETPNGLVVPVIKDADKKSIAQIATEMGELAKKARDKKLTMNDMSGACFTISSLGGIGGTGFTPIVNAPEVAILGVARSKIEPVWNGTEFLPGMILPLSLSYDHRVIDGAEAARFTRHIAAVLEDVRRLTV